MPVRMIISKIWRRPIIFVIFLLFVFAGSALFFSFKQFRKYETPFTIEWGGEASSVQLQFDKSNAFSGRFLFIAYSPTGQQMIDEYLRIHKVMDPALSIKRNNIYSAMAPYPDALDMYNYLDYVALLKLSALHYWQLFFVDSFDQSIKLSPDSTTGVYFESLFTRGLYNQPDNTLVNRLRLLIQNAAPGSDIFFSVFLFYYENPDEPILLDILAAAERGVNIQLITDLPETNNPANRGIGQIFQDAFKTRLQHAALKGHSNSWIREHAQVSWESKNHTKIFLFSDSAGQKNWTIVSSENLTDNEREKYQAGLVIRDKQTYESFKTYWEQIKDGNYKNLWAASNKQNLTHYFFPQLTGEDAVYYLLNRIKINPDNKVQTTLKISMARWNFERFPLAMKLVQLADAGIHIEIITRNNPQIVDETIIAALNHHPNIVLHTADVARLNIHSKYVLYEGCYQDNNGNDDKPKKILWVGSHNFTGMAMRNNYETWSEVRDNKIFQDFSENFSELTSLVPVDTSSENSNPGIENTPEN